MTVEKLCFCFSIHQCPVPCLDQGLLLQRKNWGDGQETRISPSQADTTCHHCSAVLTGTRRWRGTIHARTLQEVNAEQGQALPSAPRRSFSSSGAVF